MVAKVEQRLQSCHNTTLEGQRVVVLGGTGPVGTAAAVLAAQCGAQVVVMGRRQDRADRVAALCSHSFGAELTGIKGDVNDHKAEQLATADVVLGTAKAGVQVVDGGLVVAATNLKVAADLNAVPPAGIEGIGMQDDGSPLTGSTSGAVGIGALVAIAVGVVVSFISPSLRTDLPLPSELLARTNPNLIDLCIALAAGAAGGFVAVRTEASGALPGVGIAVALVPPLATVGICLGLGELGLALGALLLFSTNFVAIVLAAGLVLTGAGFAAFRDEEGERSAEHSRADDDLRGGPQHGRDADQAVGGARGDGQFGQVRRQRHDATGGRRQRDRAAAVVGHFQGARGRGDEVDAALVGLVLDGQGVVVADHALLDEPVRVKAGTFNAWKIVARRFSGGRAKDLYSVRDDL